MGCTPEYPMCKGDQHCRAGELCVNGHCGQCAADTDCLMGEKCNSGVCERPLDTCSSIADCPAGMVCLFELCTSCFEDEQCGSGRVCIDGRCAGCASDADCPEGQSCMEGACGELVIETEEVVADEGCALEPVYFEFDSCELTKDAKKILDGWIGCLDEGRTYTLIGRADSQGDEGYNLSLGLDRAKAVKAYLVKKGMSKKSLVVATAGIHTAGEDHDKDRRVDIQ